MRGFDRMGGGIDNGQGSLLLFGDMAFYLLSMIVVPVIR